MNDCQTACFVACATAGSTNDGMERLKAEAVKLGATIKRNFKELGV